MILAALIVICLAGILMRNQNKRIKDIEELESTLVENIEEVNNEFSALTGEELADCSIDNLESKVDALDTRLQNARNIKSPRGLERRKKKGNVKPKKNFRND
jgi:hypothetical protein